MGIGGGGQGVWCAAHPHSTHFQAELHQQNPIFSLVTVFIYSFDVLYLAIGCRNLYILNMFLLSCNFPFHFLIISVKSKYFSIEVHFMLFFYN